MFGFGNAHKSDVIAVADIGGGSAGVAIVKPPGKKSAHVLASIRIALSFEERSADASAAGVVRALGEAAEKAIAAYASSHSKEKPHVATAAAIIRPPWVRSKTVRAETILKEPTLITRQMIADLGQKALLSDTEFDYGKMLEAGVIHVELNGYSTSKPDGKVARSMAISALMSEFDAEIRGGALSTLQRVFVCPPPSLRSGTRALLNVLGEKGLLHTDCVVINMTSSATNIIAVRNGEVSSIERVIEGSWTIARRVANDKLPQEVFTMIRLLANDQCEGDACEKIQAGLAAVEPELMRVFGEAFARMASIRRLPNNVVLLAPHELAEWIGQFFSRIDFSQFTATTKPFTTSFASAKDISTLVSTAPGVTLDHGLAVASALVNIEHRHGA